MRITSLEVQQFGALHGRRFATDAEAVVVYGRNERGKSSFHQALRTALYGFSPATAKLHPLARPAFRGTSEPGEAVLDVTASIQGTKGSLTIERRMDATPSSRLTLGEGNARDAAFVRANEPIPQVGAVTAGLFDDVYTLDPDSTRAFDRRLGPELEELLLGSGALPGLPSITELRRSVDAERLALWRDDRRSKKTVVAGLDASLAALQAEGRETRTVEERLVRLEAQLEESTTQLAKDERALSELQHRIQGLAVIERAAHVAQSALDHDVDLKPLEGVPLESPVPMLADLEDAELLLEGPLQRLSEPAIALEPSDRALLEHRESVAGLSREEARVERARIESQSHAARAKEKRAAARELERTLRGTGSGPEPDLRPLHAIAIEWERRANTDRDGLPPPPDAGGRQWPIGVAAGAAAGGAALMGGAHWAAALLAAVAPTAAVALGSGEAHPDGGPTNRGMAAGAPPELKDALLSAGVTPNLASSPSELTALVETLARAAALRAEADDLESAEEELLQEIAAEHGRWRSIFDALMPDAPRATWASEDDIPGILRSQLERATERVREFEVDGQERKRAAQEQERAAARLRGIAERFETLREALEAAVPGEAVLERAFERAAAAHAARERARGALVELREGEAWTFPKDDPRLKRALEDGEFDASELRRLKEDASELEQRILRCREELARLDERLAHERPKRTRSSIDSEAMGLRARRAEAMGRHKQLTELYDALVEGERRHRSLHQPLVLRGAGRWLEAITEGRYRSLAVNTSEGTMLQVESREAGGLVACEPPLSRGVREQVHLALRLGVADAADTDGEMLPLLLDEALVHWDEARRAGLYRAFKTRRAAQPRGARQTFFFTCHEGLATEAVEQLGALRIDL